jgi:hypothetical protein
VTRGIDLDAQRIGYAVCFTVGQKRFVYQCHAWYIYSAEHFTAQKPIRAVIAAALRVPRDTLAEEAPGTSR